jgi:hypothetical protein
VVIATVNLQPVLAAQAAIKSTPIVFAIGGDPVEIGLVINLKTAKTLARAGRLFFESSPRSIFLLAHDLFRKPVTTFRDY